MQKKKQKTKKKKKKKKKKGSRAIQDERRGMLRAGVALLHYNACLHTSACT
jgi:hypothetical protein